jgi:hypothetical protein
LAIGEGFMTDKDKNRDLKKKLEEANRKFESEKKPNKDQEEDSNSKTSEEMPDFKKFIGCGG